MTVARHRPARLGALLSLWLLLSPGAARAQTVAPGGTPADFSVDPSGNAAARIEITVPPGPHGVQPELALAYSSQGGNGLLGVGWTLQGVSAITRGGPTQYYDGDELKPYFGQVSYKPRPDGSTNDRFFLDNQRLIAVKNGSGAALTSMPAQNAVYGKSGTQYHTAVESWIKVTSQGAAGAGPVSFVAVQKDGTTLEYGNTEDSRIQVPNGSHVRVWALSKVSDPNGNSMTFSYTETNANGEYRLASISYTANSNAGIAAKNNVTFAYEDRTDSITAYQAGYATRLTKRLKEIQTNVGTTRVRTYKLAYGYGQATQRSRLTSLQECDGGGACMPATTFSYSDSARDGTFNIVTPSQSVAMLTDFVNVYTGDYNGDGKTDFLRQEKGSWDDDVGNSFNVYLATGNGNFNIVTPAGNIYQDDLRYDPGANILPGDFNGDGKTDFLRQEKNEYAKNDNVNTFNVYFSKGDGYFDKVTPSGYQYEYEMKFDPGCRLQPGDFNGDGVSDFLRQEQNDWIHNNADNTFNVWFSRRDGYFNKVLPPGAVYQEDLKYNPGAIMIQGDYNGDGAMDFIRQEWNGWDDNASNTFKVYFSNRDGTFNIAYPPGPEYQDNLKYWAANIIPGDFNGDGLQDFIRQEWNSWDDDTIGTFQVYFSKGDGTFEIVTPSGPEYQDSLRYDPGAYIIPGDFNGDGTTDFLRQEKGNISKDNVNTFNVYLSRGNGYFDIYTPSSPDYQTRLKADNGGVTITVGDYNGDGIDDFMPVRKSSAEGSTYYWVYLAKGPFPDLLTSINDGLNKTTAITYKPLTDPSVYTKGSGAIYPVVDEQPARPVVGSFTLSDKNGNSTRMDYTYEALKTIRDGSGTSSFARIHKLDTSNNVKQTTEYHQDNFLGGQVKSIVKAEGSTTLESSTYAYYAESAPGSQPYFKVSQPLLMRTDVGHWVAGVWKYTTRQDYTYDGYGNITKLMDWGDVTMASERLYTVSSYLNNETTWILGLVTAIKQSTADGSTVTAWDGAKDLTWEKRSYDSKGNLTRQERYDNQSNVWLANVTTRNGFGDPISSADAAGSTATLVYDGSYTYVRERQVANGAQPALITKFVYDTRFGEMTSQTDPNGRTLTYTLDGFGRFTIVQGPLADNPSQSVELIRRKWENTGQGMIGTVWSRTDWSANYGTGTGTWYWEQEYTDGFGRVYKKESQGPDGRNVTEDTSYTPQGWVARRTFPHWSTETGSSLPGLTIAYDARGLPTSINSGGIVTTIAVSSDGKSFTRTEASGTPSARTTSYTLDSRLKVVRKTDAEGNVTQFQYDPLSRPIKVIDPDGVTVTTTYTSLGLKRALTDPATGTTYFTYSKGGLQSSQMDARNSDTSYAYDSLSRVLRKTVNWYKGGAPQSTVVDYQYDTANGSAAYTNLAGKLYSVITRTQGVIQSEYRFGYDVYGRTSMMEVRLEGQAAPFVFGYGYDPLGRKIEQIFPDNSRARTSYQPSGNMAVVALEEAIRGTRGPSASYTTYKGYTARGEPTGIEYGNGVQTALAFEPVLGRLTKNTMTYGLPSSASSPKLVDDQYSWDPLGDVTEIKDLRTGSAGTYDPYPFHNTTRAFTYTKAGRLATANAPGTYGSLAYTYSRGGDLLTKDGVTYTTGTGHRVLSGQKDGAQVFSATYDANGNRVTSTGENATQWEYAYGGEDRLLEVKKNNALVGTFEYDYAGRRTRKIDVTTGTTTWYVAQDYEVTTFGASAGGRTQHTKYLMGQTGPAVSITRPSTDVLLVPGSQASRRVSSRSLTPGEGGAGQPVVGTFFLHKDHIGSTQIVTDNAGKVVSRTVYKPFGEIDPRYSEGSDIHRAKYGGQELDGESGLYYFNARYYDAKIGRFLTADSVMGSGFLQVDAFNRYAFAGNNPIRNVDPSGHSFLVGLIVGAVVGATVAFAAELIQQGVTNGWGNIQVGKVFAAGLKGALSGVFAAAVGGGVTKVADKAVKKLTDGVKKGTKRAIDIGVQAVAGAAGDAAVQAASNGIQVARGQEVDWARTMLISVSVGAVAGGLGGALDGWRRGSYDVTPKDGKGSRQPKGSVTNEPRVRDHLKAMDARDWGIAFGTGATATTVSSGLNEFFDNPENNSDTVGNAFSTSGMDNAAEPQYNGRMIINVMAGQSCLSSALDDLEVSGSSQ